MYQMAKTAREKMKAKAKSLAGEKDQKVDSSDWTPASPLNADAKTGLRPISQRQYKKGGKVEGKTAKARADRMPRKSGGRTVEKDIGVGMANKDMRAANKDREGVKHVGGFKKGGNVKRASGGLAEELSKPVSDLRTRLSREDRRRKEMDPDSKGSGMLSGLLGKKYGGKIKRATGGAADGGIKDKKALGAIDPSPKRAAAEHYKKGGKVKKEGGGIVSKLNKMIGYKSPSEVQSEGMKGVGKSGTANYTQEDKGALDRAIKGTDALPSPDEAAESAARTGDKRGGMVKRKAHAAGGKAGHPDVKEDKALVRKMVKKDALTGKKKGGDVEERTARATGGRTRKGKTDIKINIIAGGPKPGMEGLGAAMSPRPPVNIPVPMPPAGGPPMGAPPMPMGAPPANLPMGRKAGGRITKVAKSYKDMEAGALSGEGRLQKTDIAKLHKDAPARKAGGKVRAK